MKVARHWLHHTLQAVSAGQCPRGHQPSWALMKPCRPIAGTGGPCEIRAHWASLASLGGR